MTAAAPPAISFFCRGRPVAKGSIVVRHVHGERTRHPRTGKPTCTCRNYAVAVQDAKLDEWTRLLATAAARAMGGRLPFTGPVLVCCDFWFARPVSHTRAQRQERYVTTTGRNDSDKLVRSVLDAMQLAACYGNDSQVQLGHVLKMYCEGDERPGVLVTLEALS